MADTIRYLEPMTATTLITNAQLVNEDQVFTSDLLIRNGLIERIDAHISAPVNATVIDAQGSSLLPGMIDDQVHFREPGLTHKGNIASESRAAVAGGITSFMEMPNTSPPAISLEALEAKYDIAAEVSAANYGFYLGATNDNLENIQSLPIGVAAGVKIFMGASTGNMLVDNETTLDGIFRDSPALIATHCESTPIIQANLEAAIERYGRDIPVTEHPNIRSDVACYESTVMAMELSRRHQAPLHVLHLSTAREMPLFEPGPMDGKLITGEVCVHFLQFSADDYPALGNRIKCNPAIKTAADKAALIGALQEGRLDIIATDHAPHTAEEKATDDYMKAPAGLPLVQDALLSVLELVHDEIISLTDVTRLTAHNPAKRYRVQNRGFLREGFCADLVMVNLRKSTDVTSQRVLSKCGWSPFEGKRLRSSIEQTWVNGQVAFDGTNLIEHNGSERLVFGAQR